MPVRAIPLYLVVLLMLGLALAPTAVASCDNKWEDRILLPTGRANPPPFATPLMNGITVQFIQDLDTYAGKNFYLYAMISNVAGFCFGSNCIWSPDFNIAFYNGGGTLLGNFAAEGPDSGTIPPHTDHAVVYMRLGPKYLSSPTSEPQGAHFELHVDCSSPPTVP